MARLSSEDGKDRGVDVGARQRIDAESGEQIEESESESNG